MTKQASIAYLSDLMDHPGRITDADMNSIGGFRQSFPYFVPARYLEAYHKNKAGAFSPAILSSMNSYMGDWMMFCDFLNADASYAPKQQDTTPATREATTPEADVALTPVLPLLQDNILPTNTDFSSEHVAQTVADVSLIPNDAYGAEAEQTIIAAEEIVQSDNKDEVLVVAATDSNDTTQQETINEDVVLDVADSEVINVDVADTSADNTHEIAAEPVVATLPQNTDDVFASLLVTDTVTNTHDAVAEDAASVSETNNLAPDTKMPVNGLITADVIEHIEAQHEQFWTGKEKELPIETAQADVNQININDQARTNSNDKPLIYPVYTEDYFLQQGEKIPADMPIEIDSLRPDEHRSLMVMMSFSEWLLHFKSTTERQKEENKDQRALKTMWQKEKLAAAIEEENEEIPENVFEMAVNSITREDGLMSESLAEIYVKQGKLDKAVEMYRKLSLRNPQKNAYFADKIKEILKENQS